MSDETQNHIEMPEAPISREARYASYEQQLADKGLDTKEELAKYYMALYRELETDQHRRAGTLHLDSDTKAHIHSLDKVDLTKNNSLEDLKDGVKELMYRRDFQNERYAELEARYAEQLEGIDTSLYTIVKDPGLEFNRGDYARLERTNLRTFEHLNTKEELKRATLNLMKERDDYQELEKHYGSKVDELGSYEKLAKYYRDLYKEVHQDDPAPFNNLYEGKT
jgi:hypothetical protein